MNISYKCQDGLFILSCIHSGNVGLLVCSAERKTEGNSENLVKANNKMKKILIYVKHLNE